MNSRGVPDDVYTEATAFVVLLLIFINSFFI